MQNKTKRDTKYIILSSIVLILFPAFLGLFCFAWGMTKTELISSVVIAEFYAALIIFLFTKGRILDELDYNNAKVYERFFRILFCCFIVSMLCHYLPIAAWPYLVLYVALTVCSNLIIGICSGTMFLVFSMLITPGVSFYVFTMYFLSGVIASFLFAQMDDSFNIVIPLVISLSIFAVLSFATIILFENKSLTLDQLFVPVIHIFLSCLALVFSLKGFRLTVIVPFRSIYMDINDQQFPLLVELKEQSPDDYKIMIHTVHFSELIGSKVNCNLDMLKTGAYYYRYSVTKSNSWDEIQSIYAANSFPKEAISLIQECYSDKKHAHTKEAAIVLMSDSVIRVLLTVMSKTNGTKLDYAGIINKIFDQKMEQGFFDQCNISIPEYYILRNTFLEENLYYDFLL